MLNARRHLDARQVGVPVVRGVGPGLPLPRRWRWSTPTSPETQLDLMLRELYLHPTGQMPAYEWNFGDVNPPVHACATLFMSQHRAEHRRRRRPSRSCDDVVPQAAAELHLVGQPQGPGRQQRVRGRLPRARQHRRVRPQRAAADGRPPRAGRRHRRGWRCSARTCWSWRSSWPRTTPTTRTSSLKFVEHFFWIAAAMTTSADADEMWDERGRLLLRRAAPPRRHARSG